MPAAASGGRLGSAQRQQPGPQRRSPAQLAAPHCRPHGHLAASASSFHAGASFLDAAAARLLTPSAEMPAARPGRSRGARCSAVCLLQSQCTAAPASLAESLQPHVVLQGTGGRPESGSFTGIPTLLRTTRATACTHRRPCLAAGTARRARAASSASTSRAASQMPSCMRACCHCSTGARCAQKPQTRRDCRGTTGSSRSTSSAPAAVTQLHSRQ